jgi:hypothetical protein
MPEGKMHAHYQIPSVESMEGVRVEVCDRDPDKGHLQIWTLDHDNDGTWDSCHVIWFEHGVIHGIELELGEGLTGCTCAN